MWRFHMDTHQYGAGQQRIKSELYRNGNLEKRKYYVGNYEKEISNGITRELHYIASPSGLVGIMERKNGENKMYYVHTDIQGSFNSITDESGNIVQEMNFDAWGKRRNPTNWSYDNLATNFLFDRGYTGHEHLDAFGLINMNGRVYDPMNGRFLSPDPFVQDPLNTQSYNRYSYCMNNPVMFIDPSGYWKDKDGRSHPDWTWDDPGGTPASQEGTGNPHNNGNGNTAKSPGGQGGGGGNGKQEPGVYSCQQNYSSHKSDKFAKPGTDMTPDARPVYMPNVSSSYNTDGDIIINYLDGNTFKTYNYNPGLAYYGNDDFVLKTVDALNKLYGHYYGKKLINSIIESGQTVNISKSSNTVADCYDVGFNPYSTLGGMDQNGNTTVPNFIGLGHELAHVLDKILGTVNYNIWVEPNIKQAEKFATHLENQLRAENGLPLRTHYGLNQNADGSYSGFAPIINGNESLYYEQTFIIKPTTTNSLFEDGKKRNVLEFSLPYKYK